VKFLRAFLFLLWELFAMVASFVAIVLAASVALVMAFGRRK
jgi:hypothetical protein